MSGPSGRPWLSRIAAAAAAAAAVAAAAVAAAEGPAAPDTAAPAGRGGAARGGGGEPERRRGGVGGRGRGNGWRPAPRSSGGSTARGSGPAEVAAPGTGRAVSPELCVELGLGEERGGGAEGGRGQRRLSEEVGVGGPGRSEGKVCIGGRGGSLRGWGRGRRGDRGEVQSVAGAVQAEGRGAGEAIRV